jgi:hypothetical protein
VPGEDEEGIESLEGEQEWVESRTRIGRAKSLVPVSLEAEWDSRPSAHWRRRDCGYETEGALLTVRTACEVAPGETLEESLPGLRLLRTWSGRGGGVQEAPGFGDELSATGVGLEAEMTDPDEAWREQVS